MRSKRLYNWIMQSFNSLQSNAGRYTLLPYNVLVNTFISAC